jgi:hypothetical protein
MAIIFLCILTISCQKSKQKLTEPAFYFWKSSFKLSEFERNTLKDNQIKKLYVKFFDISWNPQKCKPQLVAPIQFAENLPDFCQIIPVVFITNQTFVNLPEAEIDSLASAIFEKISKMSKQKNAEIQIDCDWTLLTKRKYFRFLKIIRKNNILLSATIRLHQVKFFEKTGVPPVDRGMLMCYNMSDWRNPETQNSIYSTSVLKQYIQRLENYPKPLDVVMPIFHWTVIFRNNHFLFFVNNLGSEELKNNANFTQLSNNQLFEAKNDGIFNNFSIRKGDIFRCENSDFEEVLAGSALILEKISNEKLTFALYHLDEKSLTTYSNDQIQKLLYIHETLR